MKSRQIGGSIVGTLDVVLDLIESGESWNMMSRSQRQAEKLLNKAKAHVRAINMALESNGMEPIADADGMGAHIIRFRNGCEIEAVPCDPDTTAGDARNWLLDEFGLFPRSHRLFAVIRPSIIHGKKMRIISTPRGQNHKFYDIVDRAKGDADSPWSLHKTTIQDAIRDGLRLLDDHGKPMTFDEFQESESEDMGFEMFCQEYMCMFSDRLHAFLPFDLISASQRPDIATDATPFTLMSMDTTFSGGFDVGRHRNLSVVWVVCKVGEIYKTVLVRAMENTPFDEQIGFVKNLLDTGKFQYFLIDSGGIGAPLSEQLAEQYGTTVHPFAFTNENKSQIAHRLKITLEGGCFPLPKDDEIANDFNSVQKDVTPTGKVKIAAPQTGRGHGDHFWAAALALHGAAGFGMREVAVA